MPIFLTVSGWQTTGATEMKDGVFYTEELDRPPETPGVAFRRDGGVDVRAPRALPRLIYLRMPTVVHYE